VLAMDKRSTSTARSHKEYDYEINAPEKLEVKV